MKSINRKKIRILYIETKEIKLLDIPRALDEVGFDVYKADFDFSAQGYFENAAILVKRTIEEYEIQYAITYDFSESIAQACYEAGIPYIAWVYDAPQKELYTHYAFYPSNYIFVFDKMQQRRLQEIGIKNVFHMPLAILENKVRLKLDIAEKKQKQTEITFVGQLYKKESVIQIINYAPEEVRRWMEKDVAHCFLQWDDETKVYGRMNEICIRYFDEIDKGIVQKKYSYMTEQFYYESAATSRLLANKERVTILNKLAEKYDVKFYTRDTDISQLSDKVKVLPGLHYDNELSQIYYNSKININITLHCIESGAPQRIFDVMAAGGFMLSNYQKELEELFVVGEEIALYHNLEELEELVEYYLTHEEERKKIAKKGQQKVLKFHDFHRRMEQVMEIVLREEKGRKTPYLIEQRENLKAKANELLKKGTQAAYRELFFLLRDLKNQTAIYKTTELVILREMTDCWNTEIETGISNIFWNVKSIEQAEEKYLTIKHALWRMEFGFDEKICREAVDIMSQKEQSRLLIAWIIKANLQEWEKIYILVSRYMQEYNMAAAIELLSYGILFYPGNEKLLLEKADCFMELGMWKEILETLYLVKEPSEEVEEIIRELEIAMEGAENE